MLSYANFIKEHKYIKRDSPLFKGIVHSGFTNPVEGGVVLLLSKPFEKDNYKRLYMGLIKKIRGDNEAEAIRVDLMPNLYILKEYSGGLIMPEAVEFMKDNQWLGILGMKNSGIYLNDNKTPLWKISSELNKYKFFTYNQDILKNLPNEYKDLIYPKTVRRELPNLY